ncbi:MAG: glycerol-3-phosphate dehydrogenase/oxidase [Phycisphaerae bacterium]|nr:glycerol-3-phosphate dehydrogenase/oxidase [Phycisphaerae bacterium]
MTDTARAANMRALADEAFDVLVIGGGATGTGCAVDSASRGYRTALIERGDFAKGTSSRSTKIVHGGVRYLAQMNLNLVYEALHERGIMMRNAPHLVRNLRFVVPRYTFWEGPFYGSGLKLYELLAGRESFGPSRMLSFEETIEAIPNVNREGLMGGVEYHDGQFDDARMALALAMTAADHGATVVNYVRCASLLKDGAGRVCGAQVVDEESGSQFAVRARVVVNACGVWTDEIRRMDVPKAVVRVEPAQGSHVVLPREVQPSDRAIMVPHTDDGRVLFAIPWHGVLVVGTTDLPRDNAAVEPHPGADEVEFILRNAERYLARRPGQSDILSIFAGLRPLVRAAQGEATKNISRSHTVLTSPNGLVTIIGGKWTTYRKMAEDAMDLASEVGGLTPVACHTSGLEVHGALPATDPAMPTADWARVYGADWPRVQALQAQMPGGAERIHPRLPHTRAAVAFAARHEMARTVEDVLSRRTRALLLDARASLECAGEVAAILAAELGRSGAWQGEQQATFTQLARGYLPGPTGALTVRE